MVNVTDFSTIRSGDTIFVPPMEPITARLAAGVFRGMGCRAEVLQEDERTLNIGLKHTSGNECTPCPTTIGSMIATMEDRDLDPGKVIFFMPTTCGPCRFGQYGKLAGLAFKRRGWDRIRVLAPNAENAYGGLNPKARKLLWRCVVVSDVLNKIVHKFRPYEREPGTINNLTEACLDRYLEELGRPQPDLAGILAGFVAQVKKVPLAGEKKPKIGIVGEIYVRHDPFINNYLIAEIERLGGEVLTCTLAEWVLYCAALERRSPKKRGITRNRLMLYLEKKWFASVEHTYMGIAHDLISDREEPDIEDVVREGERYVPWEFQTETILTVGRTVLFIKRDGVEAVVNASPMFCMPGTISASIFPRVEREYGVPVISNFYDGSGNPNKSLAPYLHYLVERKRNGGVRREQARV